MVIRSMFCDEIRKIDDSANRQTQKAAEAFVFSMRAAARLSVCVCVWHM